MKEKETVGLLASHSLPPNMVAVLHNLGRMLRDSHRLQLVVGDESLPKPLHGLFETVRVEPPSINFHGIGFALKAGYKYLRSYQPDTIMNVSQPYPLGAAIALLGPSFDVRTVVRITGNYMEEKRLSERYIEYVYRHVYHNVVLNSIYTRADVVLPVGKRIARHLVSNGFRSTKVRVCPQPFDAEQFSKRSDSLIAKKRIGIQDAKKTILFVGRLSWGKGADRLVEIIDRVSKNSDEFQFCVVGDGKYKKYIEEYDDGKAVSEGLVERRNIHKYYKAADLFVYPTRKDGLPNVIIEAIAARVPIVAAPVAEIPNYVDCTRKQVNGFVRHILGKNWKVCDIPKWFDWKYQKNKYQKLLTRQ